MIGLFDVLRRDLTGHVDRLRDGSRYERLGCGHHLDVPVVMNEPLAVFAVFVGGVEHLQILFRDVRGALDGLPAADVVVGLCDLGAGEAERFQQVEVPGRVLVDCEPETLESLLAESEHVEGVFQLEDPR